MMNQILYSFSYLTPETILAATLLIAVIVDLVFREKTTVVVATAIVGLLASIAALISLQSVNVNIFSGMLSVDPFSTFFKILIAVTALFIVIMSVFSKEIQTPRRSLGEFYMLLLAMTIGMFFMVGSSNLLMMYLSLELTSLSSYLAAGYTKEAKDSSEASLKYLLYGAFSSGVMLYGISILYGLTGTLNIFTINQVLIQGSANPVALLLAIVFLMVGFGYKISAVPFHFWTPDVYEGAPVTITAFLSVASKAAGFGMLMRAFKLMFIDGSVSLSLHQSWSVIAGVQIQHVLIVLSVLTMTIGNLVAVWQNNVKRLLAYSSVAQAGYMLLGLCVLGTDGFTATMIYFVVYLFMNLGAFYVVMLVANETGSEDIDSYKGLGARAPLLSVAMAIFLVSLTGIPPTAGFIGKWLIFLSLINAKMIWLAVIGVLNSVISLYYYVRIIRNLFLRDAEVEEKPLSFSFARQLLLLCFLIPTLYFGLSFGKLIEFAQLSAVMFGSR